MSPKIEHEWQLVQDHVVRSILGAMGYKRWNDADLAQASGVSKGHWQRVKMLYAPLSIDTMVKLGLAVGLRWDLQLVPQRVRQTKSAAFTVWTDPHH